MSNINEFFKLYGTQTTTNFDLKKIANELGIKNFHVLMRGELQFLKNKPTGTFSSRNKVPSITVNFITNLHTSDQNGVHWSAGIFSKNGDNYYFDSYGLPPTNEVKELLGTGTYNTFQIQTPGTTYCGQLCLYVLYKLQKGVPFLDIMLELNNL
jgi:hypothetical protein